MDRSTDGTTRQRWAVASLIGNCEAIIGSGLLPAPLEQSMRLLVAETISAFDMQTYDERNAA